MSDLTPKNRARLPGTRKVLPWVPLLIGFWLLTESLFGQLCMEDATTLCLREGRFSVTVSWDNAAGSRHVLLPDQAAGEGQAVALTVDQGYFWFENERSQKNVDVLVQVLDACQVNNKFWVFATSPTDLGIEIEVTDLMLGQVRNYQNPAGIPFPSIFDTIAFDTCMVPQGSTGKVNSQPRRPQSTAARFEDGGGGGQAGPRESMGSCVAGPDTLCLRNGRFQVQAEFETVQQDRVAAGAAAVADSTESGLFYFFKTPAVVIQILDGRSRDGHFWVNLAGLTHSKTTVRITDTVTGRNRVYVSPLGPPFPTMLDNRAFGHVDPLVFSQVVVGDVTEELTFDVELGLVNPNPDRSLAVELEMFDAALSRVDDIEIEILPSPATGQPGEILTGALELAPRTGVTLSIRLLPVPAGSGPRFVQGFMIARTVVTASEEIPVLAPIAAFAYNLRGAGGRVIDRVPVASTPAALEFQFGVSRRTAFDTGIAVATPDGPALVEVELFLDPEGAPAGSGPASRIELFQLHGHRTFFLGGLFDELPEFESALVVIRSVVDDSPLGSGIATAPLAVTALDVVSPPASTDLQIAAKELRRN